MAGKDPQRAGAAVGRTGMVNIPQDQRAFRQSDVPAHARACVADVRKITKNDILGLEKPQWNKSTDTGEKLCVRRYRLLARGERNLYQYNYRSEVPPVKEAEYAPRANKFQVPLVTMEGDPERRMALVSGDRSVRRQQEQPIHPNLDTKPQWNTTTQFSADEWRGQFESEEKQRIMNSMIKSRSLRTYKGPRERYEETLQQRRRAILTQRGGKDAERLNRLSVQ